jgi:hypothetical protein
MKKMIKIAISTVTDYPNWFGFSPEVVAGIEIYLNEIKTQAKYKYYIFITHIILNMKLYKYLKTLNYILLCFTRYITRWLYYKMKHFLKIQKKGLCVVNNFFLSFENNFNRKLNIL